MPLGFAKSVFTQASDALSLGFWRQTADAFNSNSTSTGEGSIRFTASSTPTRVNFFTMSWWMKANTNDFDGAFDSMEPFRNSNGSNGSLLADYHKNNGLQGMCFQNDSAGGDTMGTGSLGSSFNSTYVDDEWHHYFIQLRLNQTDPGQSRIMIDGVDKTPFPKTSTFNIPDGMNTVFSFFGRGDGTGDKNFSGDIAQIWLDISDNSDMLASKVTLITGITQANPAVVTSANHGRSNGDTVRIDHVVGMTQVNGREFTVANATTNTFELSGEDSSGHGGYTSAGQVIDTAANTNIGKWYNLSTTGPVDLGTDGTGTGLGQPDMYFYVDGSSVASGGNLGGTLSTQGNITITSTGGPTG